MKKQKRILVAPLNWGLGHATRCIPIIRQLLDDGAEVLLASDGRALNLLKKEFPGLPAFELPPYNIRYATRNMFFNIAYQIPKIISSYLREQQFIKNLAQKEKIDTIISDNRFGCFSKQAHNIFITHQLNIIVPFRPLEWIVNKINHFLIRKFDECWVPDFEGKNSLAGNLSKQKTLKRVKYLGPLSRLRKLEAPKIYDIIAVLSGPEPQRSYFEKAIIQQLKGLPGKMLIVQGLTDQEEHFFINENIEVLSYLTAEALNQKIASCNLVLARSGYSTVMDLVAMGKKAVLVPTPGQTEQEYLAKRLEEHGFFYAQSQKELNIAEALKQIQNYHPPTFNLIKERYLSEG